MNKFQGAPSKISISNPESSAKQTIFDFFEKNLALINEFFKKRLTYFNRTFDFKAFS